MKHLTIAIDGPAGAGKSTIARRLARRLNILYMDTGAMYRAVGLAALRRGIRPGYGPDVERLLTDIEIDICFSEGEQHVLIDGEDVTTLIRTPDVSMAASDISALPVVRHRLVELQRQIAARQPLVIDGRDIGTYVLPDAPYKFFLTASVQERARRRLADLRSQGDQSTTQDQVMQDMEIRDRQDSQREMAPLCQADDALLVDSTGLSIDEVIDLILANINNNRPVAG